MISRSAFILEKSDTTGHSPTLVFPRKKICMVKIQSQAVQKLRCKRGFNLLLHTKQIGPEKIFSKIFSKSKIFSFDVHFSGQWLAQHSYLSFSKDVC